MIITIQDIKKQDARLLYVHLIQIHLRSTSDLELTQSCSKNFSGWLFWTWDTNEQPELWNAMSDNGYLANGLSPKNFPLCEVDPAVLSAVTALI